MQIQITGRHLEVTEALKSYVESKLGKLSQHFDHIIDMHVILDVEKAEKDVQVAEARVSVPGNDIVAKAEGESMYAAIDSLKDKLDRQVIKRKQKMKSHSATAYKYRAAREIEEPSD